MSDSDSRAGRSYAGPEILDYLNRVHSAHDAGLEAAFSSPETDNIPGIQLAPQEGRFLELLMRMTGAARVVEIGTLAGYSAIRIARGLAPGGRLWTLEVDPKHADIATRNLGLAGVAERVEVVVGDAGATLPELARHGPFDAVFIDADKERYPVYGQWAADNLRTGGLLIGDNAFLFGRLLEDSHGGAEMRRFHEQAAAEFDSCCLPTPDGLLIAVKR